MQRLLLALFCTLVAACVFPAPVFGPKTEFGEVVAEQQVQAAVLPGQTQDELRERLGPPTYELRDGSILAYRWQRKAYEVVVAPFGAAPVWEKGVFVVAFNGWNKVVATGNLEYLGEEAVPRAVEKWLTDNNLRDMARPVTEPQRLASASIVVYGLKDYCGSTLPQAHHYPDEREGPMTVLVGGANGWVSGELLRGEYLAIKVQPGESQISIRGRPATHAVVRPAPDGVTYVAVRVCAEVVGTERVYRYEFSPVSGVVAREALRNLKRVPLVAPGAKP